MKFIISRQELAELLGKVQNIVAPKAPIPILQNFELVAEGSNVILTATDLTVGVRCMGSAKVEKAGATTLPARRFAQLVRELTSSHLEITTNAKEVTQVIADSSTFRIPGLPRTDFPGLPDLTGASKVTFKQGRLKEALYRTAFAVSKEDARYVFTGVFCQIVGGSATFVGTDGKRMARYNLPLELAAEQNSESIIPLKAVDEISKILNREDELCSMYIMQDKVAFETSDTLIVSKLLTGDYPDVDRVIPEQSNSVVQLHREELMSLLRQMALFITDEQYATRFTFVPGELQLSSQAMDMGEGKVSMPVNYTGERFDIAFNPAFFLDILRHSKNETVSIGFTDGFNPGLIVDGHLEANHKELPSQLYVLMPLRLADGG